MKFGLIGRRLSHSFSKQFFAQYFEKHNIKAQYDNIELNEVDDFKCIIQCGGYSGFSVTNPYKELIMMYLDEIDKIAKAVGAVNCIKVEDGRLIGYNTDIYGFRTSIEPYLKPFHKRALILGSGGASKAVQAAFRELSIDYHIVSRNVQDNTILYNEVDKSLIETHQIVVNATPLGMFPNIEEYPDIPYQHFGNRHIMFDLIYNPEKTVFLKKGEQQKAVIINGLKMLHLQALKAIEIFGLTK
ncbi:MAG: shikimate dehydrogenase [Porphyromonadaceae bacterium]|nr:shikimate dehydrogenase [Porphyromonadaceae bacterium]